MPLLAFWNLSSPFPDSPTGRLGPIHLVHPERYSRAIPIDSMPSLLSAFVAPWNDVLAKFGIATVLFTLQYLPHALIWGTSRVTGMLTPELFAATPILGEKLVTRVDLFGRLRSLTSDSIFFIIPVRYSSVPIFVIGCGSLTSISTVFPPSCHKSVNPLSESRSSNEANPDDRNSEVLKASMHLSLIGSLPGMNSSW